MRVSVIIPTYNRAKTIGRAVDSVLAQTWKEIEIIVVDDGSTDQTADILKAYGDKIRVIYQKNGGASAARNTGIKDATGEIISFLDSDDEWLPTKTEQQVKLLIRTQSFGTVCCVCNARIMRSSGMVTSFQTSGLCPPQAEGVWSNPAQTLTDRFLLFNQVVAVWRKALDRSGFFRENFRIMEDYDLALRLALTGPWAFVAEPLVVWHEDAGSGLSRNVTELVKCQHALMILNQFNRSTDFGARLPWARLLHRRLLLKRKIDALALSSKPGGIRSAFGKYLFLCLKSYEALSWRLRPKSRMITRPL